MASQVGLWLVLHPGTGAGTVLGFVEMEQALLSVGAEVTGAFAGSNLLELTTEAQGQEQGLVYAVAAACRDEVAHLKGEILVPHGLVLVPHQVFEVWLFYTQPIQYEKKTSFKK